MFLRIEFLILLFLIILLYHPIIENFITLEECNKQYEQIKKEKDKSDESIQTKRDNLAREKAISDGALEADWKLKISDKELKFKELLKTVKDTEAIYNTHNNKKTACEADLSNFGFKLSDAKDRCKNGKKEIGELNDSLVLLLEQNNKIIISNKIIQANINKVQNDINKYTREYNNKQNKIKDLTNKLYIKNQNHLR